MNKLWLLLSVLVITLFVIGCAPKEVIEGEEGAEEVGEEGGALAGQANYVPCTDSDGGKALEIKGTTVGGNYPKGKEDYCQVNGKLREYYCMKKTNKVFDSVADCTILGSSYVCKEGACCTPKCEGKQCGDNGCGGSCGTCPAGQDCQTDGTCKAPAPTCTPGLTGDFKCYSNLSGTFAQFKLYYANCTTYLAPGGKLCGETTDSCVEPTGCK